MAEHRTLNPQVEGSIPSAPIRAISHEVALFFCPPPAAQALALFRLRSIRARFALFRCAPYGLYAGYVLGLAPLRAYAVGYGHSALFRLRSIRALRRLCARACALARIRRRLRYCPQRGAIRSASYSSISCLCLPKQGYLRARCSPPTPIPLRLSSYRSHNRKNHTHIQYCIDEVNYHY